MSKPILYSYWRSSCSWRVRIALNLKEIDYDYRTVNLLSKEALEEPEFVKANPAKKVPAFVDNGKSITESLAIIEYLEEKYPDRFPLLPKDLAQRGQARAVALQIAAGIQPLQNLRVLKYLNAEEAGKGAKWAQHWLIDGLRDLEHLLEQTSGKFAVGDQVSIGDIGIPSILYNAKRFNVDTSQFPILSRLDKSLSLIDQFAAAHPDKQPDANLNA
ncbi:unnamed protein product, partial [Mesorhabditis belari]|uniref:maleylacetoacetate isomerase n=1 Tax=Mesorhabditis belari TaxID=2138241 RepID=A0AAF3EGN6_9BILA